MKKPDNEQSIIVTNRYIDELTARKGPKEAIEHNKTLPVKARYWLARAFDKLEQEARIYFKSRQQLVNQYASYYDADLKGEDGKVLHKKGDIISYPDGSVQLQNLAAFQKDLLVLQEIEIRLDINKVALRLEDVEDLDIEQMQLLLPLVDITVN